MVCRGNHGVPRMEVQRDLESRYAKLMVPHIQKVITRIKRPRPMYAKYQAAAERR